MGEPNAKPQPQQQEEPLQQVTDVHAVTSLPLEDENGETEGADEPKISSQCMRMSD